MNMPSDINGVKIQLLRPGYEYPENTFEHRDALYYPSKDIVFIATKISSGIDDDVYTEVATWNPDEIRLLGTLTLSIPENGGWVAYYPWSFSFIAIPTLPYIPVTTDLSSDNAISLCLEYVRGLLDKKLEPTKNSYILRSQQSLPRSEAQIENRLFENIDPTNSLLIRGLYHLIKCPSLIAVFPNESMFMEEAFMDLQISTEAAFKIIRERLCDGGNPHPSKKDIHEYINSNFTRHGEWVEYLEEQHEKWIETKQPVSEYASGWAPSLLLMIFAKHTVP